MVRRMLLRGAVLTVIVVAVAGLVGGGEAALSAAVGGALALLNLWIAGRVIGGIAENAPHLLVPAAIITLVVALVLVVASGTIINRTETLDYTITGLVLVGLHLVLVTWEAAASLLKLPQDKKLVTDPRSVRS